MSYSEATLLLESLEIKGHEDNLEIALDVIKKYGSYKKALQATISIEFKKKEALLIALLGSEEKELETAYMSEAKRLIKLVRGLNHQVYLDSQRLNMQFSDLVQKIKLKEMGISKDDISTLDKVRPFRDHKHLISEINCFQDGKVQLNAFIEALQQTTSINGIIENKSMNNLRIKR